MKPRQEISDEEIQHFMDFDRLLRQKEKFVARRKYLRNIKILASTVGGLGIVGAVVFLTLTNQPSAKVGDPVQQKSVEKSIKKADSSTAQLNMATEKENASSDHFNTEQRKPEISGTVQRELTSTPETSSDESIGTNHDSENRELPQTKMVYQQAEPVNGYPDLYAYFDKELIYPVAALQDSVQGVVTVAFTINASGKAEDIQIENSLGKLFDDEVIRVLENMPLWKPAYYNGRLMKSKVSLPLTFRFTKVSSKE